MSQRAKPSLLEIEQEIEAQAREWHRQQLQKRLQQAAEEQGAVCPHTGELLQEARYETVTLETCAGTVRLRADRKSTRLNSSHLVISYAVFCLKKNTQDDISSSPIVVAVTNFHAALRNIFL